MSQILLILGVIGLILLISLYRKQNKSTKNINQEMVKCGACGVNIPKSEALLSKGKWFCSKDHIS